MWRNLLAVVLAWAVLLFSSGDPLRAQNSYPQYPGGDPAANAPGAGYGGGQYPQGGDPYGGQYPAQPAAPYPSSDPAADPNAGGDAQHGVARLSVVQGDVNLQRADNGELVAAIANAPVMLGDHLQVSPGSRAEVELDSGDLVRLGPDTDVGFVDLAYHRYQFQLAAGTIIYRVLRDANAQAEIDTPSIALRPEGQGEYRISVLPDGTTQISVRSGQAEIFSPRGSEQIGAGRTILVRGSAADPEFQQIYDPPRDQFDDWSANRDRQILASQSYRYISPDIAGGEDLDANGSWVPSQYGQVWQPNDVGGDWSPYSDGQWSYQPYYGWTWVDAAAWGWAPYHYGRWFWNGGHHWCWWPGAVGPRYLWSPALVGFFGVGVGVGVGLGALGWVALAPFETFHAWWGVGFGHGAFGFGGFAGRGYLAGYYHNAAIRGGALTASYSSFGGFRQHFSAATAGQLSGASLVRGGLPVTPNRASYGFGGRAASYNPHFASAENRTFFSHQAPQNRAGFAAGRAGSTGFARVGGGVAANRQTAYGRSNVYAAAPNRSQGSSGWQRFGDPGRSNGVSQGFARGQEQSGWHTFGESRPASPSYNYSRGSGVGSYGTPRYAAPAGRPGYSEYRGGNSGYGNYGGGRSNYSAPRSYSPPAQHYSAPAQHYSAPAGRGGGGGGQHSSSGGHRGR